MFLNNSFSKKNNYLYKMKCLNTRNSEYYEEDNNYSDKIEKNNIVKKVKDKQ